jgi:hypothetical protein
MDPQKMIGFRYDEKNPLIMILNDWGAYTQ